MKTKLHYVFFTRTLPHHGCGGMEVLIWNLMTKILCIGNAKVTVITTTIPNYPDKFEFEGVDIVSIPDVIPRRYTRKWWKLSADYFDMHLRETTHCVISVAMGAAGLLFQRKRFNDVPIVCQAHGTVVSEIISKLRTKNVIQILKCLRQIKYFIRENKIYRHADKIIAVGGIVNETLEKFPYNTFVNPDKVVLIENGVDSDKFRSLPKNRKKLRENLNIDEGKTIILSVSRLIKQKGVKQAIRAVNELNKKGHDVHYLIVGSGNEKKQLMDLVDTLNMNNFVTFVGSITYKNVHMYYQASDVFLFPTLRMEGAPLNIIEALSVGMPVVASNYLTNYKCISKYITLVDPNSTVKLSEALEKTIRQTKDERISLSKRFSLLEMTQKYLNEFDTVINTYHNNANWRMNLYKFS